LALFVCLLFIYYACLYETSTVCHYTSSSSSSVYLSVTATTQFSLSTRLYDYAGYQFCGMAPEVLTVAHPQQPYEALLEGRINTVPIIMVGTCGGYDDCDDDHSDKYDGDGDCDDD